ncbi:hypothetical protein HY29_15620 [Hyphomonas beringensis]|uniref:Uncharacterized protein n=1 Tax=Hyphomonas beringensis TaxID=1280946 RepID=A0A062UDJ6_9PROT|nr:hypothetical protein [Hyphomonas beringensis]KCZ54170.1 hypothetical protein HY29_15620 [Hyphomonas beringensis]
MPKILHPVAGALAMILIGTFWLSTVVSELSGDPAFIQTVKTAIPWGFLLLVPAIATAGGTGVVLSKGRTGGLPGVKLKRMPFIAANGLFILIPAAFFLAAKARGGDFDTTFYIVQALELIAGLGNIILLGLNMRDGFRMKGRFRKHPVIKP